MARVLKINGIADESKIILSIDDITKEFDLTQNISAEEIFKILDYHRGDTYEVNALDNGCIDKRAFDAFIKLMKDIADKINGYAEIIANLDYDELED